MSLLVPVTDGLVPTDPSKLIGLMPFRGRIFLKETHVAGMMYREDIGAILECIKEGDALKLRREPSNPYDEKAIMVLDESERHIGYVPRTCNEILANLMDGGKRLCCTVCSIGTYHGDSEVRIRISLDDYRVVVCV